MNSAVVRAAIVAMMQSVPDVGAVHAYERHAERGGELRDLYVVEVGGRKLLRGWYVRRASVREVSGTVGVATVVSGWRIVGYHGLEDGAASETAFDTLLDAARAAFRADPTLGGAVADLCDLTASADSAPYGLQIEDFAPVLFGGALAHRAQLALVTSQLIRY
jgi:hypothetical protein